VHVQAGDPSDRIESNRAKKAERRKGQWPSGNSRGWEAAGGGSSPRPAPGCRDSVHVCWRVSVCVNLGMACFNTTRTSFVCVEFGQYGRSKILHDSPIFLGA